MERKEISISRYYIYELIENWENLPKMPYNTQMTLRMSICILKNLEKSLFRKTNQIDDIRNIAIINIYNAFEDVDIMKFLEINVDVFSKLQKLLVQLNDYGSIHEVDKKKILASLIKFLNETQEKFPFEIEQDNLIKLFNINGMKMVFTSYSYDERFFSFGLFLYFLQNGVYLYLDWMHNQKLEPILLKIELSSKIRMSKQFLFLRSPRSELRLSGSGNIRQWCAWEIGQFYKAPDMEKFYLDTYDIEQNDNELLKDFRRLYGIENRELV